MLRNSVKSAIRQAMPGVFYAIKRRQTGRAFRIAHGGAEYRAAKALAAGGGLRVLAGPFIGMRYGRDVNCGAYVAKLVGSYEEELHQVVAEIIGRAYRRVIDVGAAEGYYAVGLARCLPTAAVFAYDNNHHAQRYCRDLAKLNDVAHRVSVRGWCDATELRTVAGLDAVLICDCEGYELDLLNPAAVPELSETDILVELHELLRPGVTAAIVARFEPTHEVRLIDTQDRDPKCYPQLASVAEADRPWALREGRGGRMQWAWMKRQSPTPPGAYQ